MTPCVNELGISKSGSAPNRATCVAPVCSGSVCTRWTRVRAVARMATTRTAAPSRITVERRGRGSVNRGGSGVASGSCSSTGPTGSTSTGAGGVSSAPTRASSSISRRRAWGSDAMSAVGEYARRRSWASSASSSIDMRRSHHPTRSSVARRTGPCPDRRRSGPPSCSPDRSNVHRLGHAPTAPSSCPASCSPAPVLLHRSGHAPTAPASCPTSCSPGPPRRHETGHERHRRQRPVNSGARFAWNAANPSR